MKAQLRMGLVLAIIVAAGCVPSLHPLYTEADLIFDPALVGTWGETNSPERWAFTKADDTSYKLVYTDKDGKTGEFSAHLLKVQGTVFLDLFPEDPKLAQNDFYKIHLVPAHTFLLVPQLKPTLQLVCLDPDWTKKYLTDHPTAVRHEKVNDGIVFTAPPKELQKFLLANLKTEEAFGRPMDLEQIKPAASK